MGVKRMILFECVLFSLFCNFLVTDGSAGDISSEQQICSQKCDARNCTGGYKKKEFFKNQKWYEGVIGWSCLDDCKYNCMWKTIEAFHKVPSTVFTPYFNL